MKRLIPAGILLLAVISSYILSLSYITSTCKETHKLLTGCEEDYKDNRNAEVALKKLTEAWNEKEQLLSFFVNHDKIDEIELELSSLKVFCKSDESLMFFDHTENLKMLLHQIIEDTQINTHSVF